MKRGAIRAFLERNASGQPTQITSHFKDCIQLLSVAEYFSQQK